MENIIHKFFRSGGMFFFSKIFVHGKVYEKLLKKFVDICVVDVFFYIYFVLWVFEICEYFIYEARIGFVCCFELSIKKYNRKTYIYSLWDSKGRFEFELLLFSVLFLYSNRLIYECVT